jgi:hypothetical protein
MVKYFIVGARPVFFEKNINGTVSNSFMLDWNTGKFVKDEEYWLKIIFGRIDEIEEVSKVEFDIYVNKLKRERGLI